MISILPAAPTTNPNLETLQFDKKTLRLIKNREAADLSRKKKKLELAKLQQRVQDLEKRVEELETENDGYRLRIKELESSQNVFKDTFSTPFGGLNAPLPQGDLFSDFNVPVLQPSSPQSSTESTLFSDTPSPQADDFFNFVNLDFSETSTLGFFAIFLLSFTSFLTPFSATSKALALGSKASVPSRVFHTVPQESLVKHSISKVKTLQDHSKQEVSTVNPLSLGLSVWPTFTKRMPISTQKDEFVKTLSLLSQINPPNAISSIEGLFTNSKFMMNAEMSIGQWVMLSPDIRLVSGDSDMEVSLLTKVPAGGLLKLDMSINKATWLS